MNVNGWDVGRIRFESALGTVVGLSMLARAATWWIDRDLARRAVPPEIQEFYSAKSWPTSECGHE